MITRAKHGIFKPKKIFSAKVTLVEPRSVAAALASPKWVKAMKSEFQALQDNKTWILVPYTT